MTFQSTQLSSPRPDEISTVNLPFSNHSTSSSAIPKVGHYTPSPQTWQDEVLYFLMVDRFSNGKEKPEKLLDRSNLAAARPTLNGRDGWYWEDWAFSGAARYQGGNLKGVKSKLGYLKTLGVSSIWLSPVFKQRTHLDTYHGYGIQDFLDVDPRFGTRKDLVDLVDEAHKQGIRIILDIIFNHSGHNWDYPGGQVRPPYKYTGYDFGNWLDGDGQHIDDPETHAYTIHDAVFPLELRAEDCYSLKGKANLSENDYNNPEAEHKRGDFEDLRDFDLNNPATFAALVKCYSYWIALADHDGYRFDTLKHVSKEQARNFCGAIKEYAALLGKSNFLLIGEVAGGDNVQQTYLNAIPRNLDSVLDIGSQRVNLSNLAKGLSGPRPFFGNMEALGTSLEYMPSHRVIGDRHVSILNDHDHVYGEKIRFAYGSSEHQVILATAIQLFTLGIPCIYYGTEQAFSGPRDIETYYLPEWCGSDRYLREAMFGPLHSLAMGKEGFEGKKDDLPGFGPFGTAGRHCFDENFICYKKIGEMAKLRKENITLRQGRQYQRDVAFDYHKDHFTKDYEGGQIIAWSRILDNQEFVIVCNTHGNENRSGAISIDANLNEAGSQLKLVFSSHDDFGDDKTVWIKNGFACIMIDNMPPAGILVFRNFPS